MTSVAAASRRLVGVIVQRSAGLREIALSATLAAKNVNATQVKTITAVLSPAGTAEVTRNANKVYATFITPQGTPLPSIYPTRHNH